MNFKPENIKIIIGLGNPGRKYENTYHSVGFLFIDYLSKNPPNEEFQISNFKLLKSGVYMNQSGEFVKETLKKKGIKPKELLVVHDDSDIKLGEYKFSFERGSAGHKGIQSIISHLHNNKFWRLRIGIRKEKNRTKAGSFVLREITARDQKILKTVFKEIVFNLKRY